MLTINEKLVAEWIFESGNPESVQQCPLPNLECGETTKERLVELLNTIYPHKETSKNGCDTCGFSSVTKKTTSNNSSSTSSSKCREEGQTNADFQLAPVNLSSSRSDIESKNNVGATPHISTSSFQDTTSSSVVQAEKSFVVITLAPPNSLVPASTHGDVKRSAQVTLSTEKARLLLAYRKRLAYEKKNQGELAIPQPNVTENQVTGMAQMELVEERLTLPLNHKSKLAIEAEIFTKSFNEECCSLAACVDEWQSTNNNENGNVMDAHPMFELRRPLFWCSGKDCLRTIFFSYSSVVLIALIFLTFFLAISSSTENHHPALDAKVFQPQDIFIDTAHIFQDFPIVITSASRSINDKLSAMAQVVGHPTPFDIDDNATKIDTFTQLVESINDCAGINSFLVALCICALYTLLLVIKCLLFATIQ